MLNPVVGLPSGVFGLLANGTVVAGDVTQALISAKPSLRDASGFVLVVDPDLDGYLSEIVSALETAAKAQPPQFQRWALVVPDAMVSEAELLKSSHEPRIFPKSLQEDALSWAQG